ncbi:MAG: hypothetical protein EHM89_02240 [Acidobacteria bacterium]|nr:MAG: hypothetical protein EHM89_02240 [Acidobacteriota bacterium]
MTLKAVRYVVAMAAAGVALAPEWALACPVCFGALDGPLADGANKAVLALLGITMSVLAAFATFFIYLVRRARTFETADSYVGEVNNGAASVNRGNIMEGTA